MQKGKIIGQGNTAEVYCWGEKEILKLFRKEFPKKRVEEEYLAGKEVQNSGLPVPKVGEMLEYDNRLAITYERIFGESMLAKISKKPWTVLKEARRLAELHYRIHQCSIKSVPKQKIMLERNIQNTELLSDEKKRKVLNILKELPDGEILCHGDFHPGNVLVEADKEVVIDWMSATSGCAEADIARTMLLLKDAALPAEVGMPIKLIITFIRSHIFSEYIKRYLELSKMTMEEIKRWQVPVAAARLIEFVPKSEKEYLMELIDKNIK